MGRLGGYYCQAFQGLLGVDLKPDSASAARLADYGASSTPCSPTIAPGLGGALLEGPVRVILVTDGDKVARRAMEESCRQLGLRCISSSAGNPSPFTGPELVQLIQQAVDDPVLVMVDDKGNPGRGAGESALAYLCKHRDVRILGAIAVASNTRRAKGIKVDLSVTRDGAVIRGPVDKDGYPVRREELLQGDTVDVLRELKLPVVVGVGDPGKMEGADGQSAGYAVTTRAIREVLSRSLGE